MSSVVRIGASVLSVMGRCLCFSGSFFGHCMPTFLAASGSIFVGAPLGPKGVLVPVGRQGAEAGARDWLQSQASCRMTVTSQRRWV
jgi:hypothetical protein